MLCPLIQETRFYGETDCQRFERAGKRVFMRVDYNVPLEEKDGQMVITDATRIVETLPTLRLLIEQGGETDPGRPPRPAQGQTRAVHVAAPGGRQTGRSARAARSPSSMIASARRSRRRSAS